MAAEADIAAAAAANARYNAYAAATTPTSSPPSEHQQRQPQEQQPPPPPPPPAPEAMIATLPPAVICTFVGEGSANAVFCLTPQEPPREEEEDEEEEEEDPFAVSDPSAAASSSSSSSPLATHLLRIPKAGPGVNPATCLDHHAYYATVLQPLLGADCLVGQRLVRGVAAGGVAAAVNALLAELYRTRRRRPDWVGSRVAADVDVALLVEDMSSMCRQQPGTPSANSITIQFKPKWLVQSPSAPAAGARRCRTCALSAAAAADAATAAATATATATASAHGGGAKAKKAHKIKPCPLVLVAPRTSSEADEREVENALWAYVCQHLPGGASLPPALLKARPAIVRWLRATDLFRRLAAIQQECDPLGALSLDAPSAPDGTAAPSVALGHLQTAMTLRDCTCYLRVSWGSSGDGANPSAPTITAKLGDLDRKDGPRKLGRWQAQERALLAGGFYSGAEQPRQRTDCWLERRQR